MSRTSKALIVAIFAVGAVVLRAQQPWQQSSFLPLSYGMAAPAANCSAGSMYVQAATAPSLWLCTAANTWSQLGFASAGGVPAGAIVFIDTGSCPSGYAEVAGLDGKTVLGTLNANGNVGGTGGADTITPAGSVAAPIFTGSQVSTSAITAGTPAGSVAAPTFTGSGWTPPAIAWPAGVPTFAGSALATHAHELPWQLASTTTIRQIAVATFGQGTSRAATAVSAAGTANTTSAAVALSQAVTAGTPAGTVAWPAGVPTIAAYTPAGTNSAPAFTGSALGTHQHTDTAAGTNSAPAFTGSQFDNRSAFVRLIGCKKS